ncbi:tetratricopeptide repeat protein [Spartinivicinus poritis]|uniref:Tetratricopeptide repeat protein n=1 Tax=Spartinivicinus poritis TaxID=2994640 RepID=A0ABT5U7X2_9GAMM|nr:tetratricopeptide repeat protein [Spartinivicinus sp. A2-2]MDE1462422.1 tetratricopeptide repeat protein [Spartinivicinus sp. A2-2]
MKFNRIGIAKRLILAEKYKQAKKLLIPLAKKGNAEAQLILGYLYYGSDPEMSAKESEYWLKKSANNKHPEAVALLANTNYKKGCWSSVPSTQKAIKQLEWAARKGSAEAQRSLACAYAHGEVVPLDNNKVMYWDELAAKQGLAESQNDLALMLLFGEGGKADIEQAIYWYEQSASKDYNVPHAQWAAEILASIYMGEFDTQYLNEEKASYWQTRASYLGSLSFRSHPDWFYK